MRTYRQSEEVVLRLTVILCTCNPTGEGHPNDNKSLFHLFSLIIRQRYGFFEDLL